MSPSGYFFATGILSFIRRYYGLSWALAAVFVLTAGYIGAQALSLVSVPQLVVSSPAEMFTATSENSLTVKGSAKDETRLLVNRRPVALNEANAFEERLYLAPGLNRIEFEATTISGKSVEEVRYILYQLSL